MTVGIVYSSSGDGYISSSAATYAGAYNGTSLAADTSSGNGYYGRNNNSSSYAAFEAFTKFAYTAPTDEVVTSAAFRVIHATIAGTGISRNLEFRGFDWGASLTTADWRTPTQIAACTLYAQANSANSATTSKDVHAGSDTLLALLGSSATINVLMVSNNQRSGSAPTGDEGSSVWLADASGTTYDPALVYTSVPQSTLFRVLGAQVQLSDGTWAVLSSDGAASPTILLRHVDASGTASTVGSVLASGGDPDGSQSAALAVDSADNLYVVRRNTSSGNSITAFGFVKGTGHTWTLVGNATTALPSYSSAVNNVAVVWHAAGAGGGTVVAVVAHTAGTGVTAGTNEVSYLLLNCQFLLTGSGSLLRSSASAMGVLVPSSLSGYTYTAWANETGSGLDVVAASATKGFVLAWNRRQNIGDNMQTSVARYTLASNGASLSGAFYDYARGYGVKTASGKVRAVGISENELVTVTTDSDLDYGPTVVSLQNSGTDVYFNELGYTFLSAEGISSLSSEATMSTTQAWDALYNATENKLWFYYLDTADGLRLMRTAVDLNTYYATGEEVEVSASVGAAGSTNLAMRVARNASTTDAALVTVANRSSGGTLSTIYVVDSFNLPPTTPTLTAKANFDGTANSTFAWTFNDPNAGDSQSAYQLEINTSAGVSAYDSTKTASSTASHALTGGTLANPGSWQWRVKAWDAADEASPWSNFGTFSTSAGGTATITVPASDNPAGVITADYEVTWSVADTTQVDYRVVLVRTDTEVTVSTTGWVTSTDTSYTVTGMVSDVEHRVEVTVRNAGLVESGTGTRLITPSYASPEDPVLSVTPVPAGGYMLLSVTNPSPQGDRPEVSYNQIARALAGTGDYAVIADGIAVNGSYRDYAAASGVAYDYIANGVV